jgi:YD repeat-containing protein
VTSPAPNSTTPASVTKFQYDSKGELTQITDPLNHVTTLTYTSAGLIATIKDAQQNITTYGYNVRGNRTSVIDPINGSAPPTSVLASSAHFRVAKSNSISFSRSGVGDRPLGSCHRQQHRCAPSGKW